MPIPSSIADLSTTASLNSPAGSDNLSTTDDYLRAIQAILKTEYNTQATTNAAQATTNAAKAALAGATFTGPINEARGTVTMHATTMDLWARPNTIDGTGSAVTITAIANAPQAGSRRTLYPIAATVITNGATFAVDGAADYTTAAGDALEFEAVTTSTYKVHITKVDGTAVASGFATQSDYNTGTDTTKAVNSSILRANNIVLSTPIATTSGTSHDFTGIPSWVKKINIMITASSTNGTSKRILQIGDSGGIENTSYVGAAFSATATYTSTSSGFLVVGNAAPTDSHNCLCTLSLMNSATNTWCFSSIGSYNVGAASYSNGYKSLSGTLDRIRYTTEGGANTFDAGSINISYE